MKRIAAWVCVLLAILLSATTIHGQGNLGAITGTIQDSSGAAVPDLPLTITNIETGVKWIATTSSAGYYRVSIPPGIYRLEAQKQGFKTEIADKILVPVAQVVTVGPHAPTWQPIRKGGSRIRHPAAHAVHCGGKTLSARSSGLRSRLRKRKQLE